MSDYGVDEDTIVVRSEPDGSSRRPRKKLPQSRSSDSTTVHTSSFEPPRELGTRSASVKRDSSLDWLLQSNRHKQWPAEPTEFLWRYMHQHDLYTKHPSDADVMPLVKDIKRHLGITHTDELDSVMCGNLKAFISTWTNKWHSEGRLIECWHPNSLSYRRSPRFNALLQLGSKPWLVHTAVECTGQHPPPQVTPSEPGPVSQKRDRESIEGGPRHKRRKENPAQAVEDDEVEQMPVRIASRLQTPPGSTSGEEDGNRRSPIKSSDQVNVFESASRPQAASGWVAVNDSISSTPSVKQQMPEDILKPPSRAHTEARDTKLYHHPSPANDTEQSTVETLQSFPTMPTTPLLSSLTTNTTPQPSSNPIIQFIIQKRNLSLDFAHPLPSLRDLTVPELFTLFSIRSGHPPSQLHTLTFDILFAGRSKLVLRRDDSEVCWRGLKRRISWLLRDARRRGVEEGCFEVWIREGEGGGESEDGEEDEFEGL